MATLGLFLDMLCSRRPDIAEQLLTREIGPLHVDVTSKTCGCVVATAAMALGFVPALFENHDVAGRHVEDYLAEFTRIDPSFIAEASVRVFDISMRIAYGPEWRRQRYNNRRAPISAERKTIHLVRQRIAVRLAMAGVR